MQIGCHALITLTQLPRQQRKCLTFRQRQCLLYKAYLWMQYVKSVSPTDGHKRDIVIGQWKQIMAAAAASRNGIYPSGNTYEDAFWRLMVADVIEGGRATASDEMNSRMRWDPDVVDLDNVATPSTL